MISVEHMQELIDRFNSGELDIRDIIEQSYFGGRADAIDEFVKMFIDEGNKRKYLRHIWIEQTCNKIAEQLKEQTE